MAEWGSQSSVSSFSVFTVAYELCSGAPLWACLVSDGKLTIVHTTVLYRPRPFLASCFQDSFLGSNFLSPDYGMPVGWLWLADIRPWCAEKWVFSRCGIISLCTWPQTLVHAG